MIFTAVCASLSRPITAHYQRLGFYKTFPQRDLLSVLLNTFVAPLMSIRRLRQEFNKQVKVQMAAPLKQCGR